MLSMQIPNYIHPVWGECKFNAFNIDTQLFIPRLRGGVNLMFSMQILNFLHLAGERV